MRSRLHLSGTLCAAAFLAACGGASEAPVTTTTPDGRSGAPSAAAAEQRDTALVRVVHAVPSGSTVDVTADDLRVFEAVSFRDITPYKEVDGQRYGFALRAAGAPAEGEPLASSSEGLSDGEYYTVFALPGEDGEATLQVVQDNHEEPAEGKARVRVVNAAADAGEIDVLIAGQEDALISGVDFRSVTSYDEVDPQAGELMLRANGGKAAVADLGHLQLEAGKAYTIVVVNGTSSQQPLETLVFEDAVATAGY
jgi:hypothetical protein